MERMKIGVDCVSQVIEVTPEALRDLANKLEARSKMSSMGTSVFLPISNSVSFLYNVPIKESHATTIMSSLPLNQ